MSKSLETDALVLGASLAGMLFLQAVAAVFNQMHWHHASDHESLHWENLPDSLKTQATLQPMLAHERCDEVHAQRFWFEFPPYPECTPTP